MARLIDTSLRLLGQDPLAARVSTARVLDVAALLDRAGFHALEVSGGGCFQTAVARAVESPWEIIRALKGRAPRTPLAMALRGTFLVGQRPVARDVVRRFILCAAESGIDIFRLHDPLNDALDLAGPAEAVREAGARLYAGLVYTDGPGGDDVLLERARSLAALGADRVLLHDPGGQLSAAVVGDLVRRLRDAAGVPIGLYCQGPGGTALAVALEAARAGADPIAVASYPVAVPSNRPSSELLGTTLAGLGLDTGVDDAIVGEAALAIDRELGSDESLAPPLSAHVSLLAALNRVPAGLVGHIERRLAALAQGERLAEVLAEVRRVQEEIGSPPTASPIGSVITRQAIQHVLTGRRWDSMSESMRLLVTGEWGQPPGPVDPTVRAVAGEDPLEDTQEFGLDEARADMGELAASEEELCLVALFGEESRPLLERLRGRDDPDLGGAEPREEDRIRRLVQILEESGMSELTVEEGSVRITLRKESDVRYVTAAAAATPAPAPVDAGPPAPPAHPVHTVESPMVGTFYRAPGPDEPPFVEVGDRVEVGAVLGILEAMKLFNELKADHAGVVRRVLVENAAPVEFGQALFELEPA